MSKFRVRFLGDISERARLGDGHLNQNHIGMVEQVVIWLVFPSLVVFVFACLFICLFRLDLFFVLVLFLNHLIWLVIICLGDLRKRAHIYWHAFVQLHRLHNKNARWDSTVHCCTIRLRNHSLLIVEIWFNRFFPLFIMRFCGFAGVIVPDLIVPTPCLHVS